MLLRQIDAGLLKAGDRLPSSAELAASLGAHPITVHKALHRLKIAGLVDRTPRLGTFLRRGREAFRIAVMFGPSLNDESAYFYRALLRALQNDPTIPQCQYLPYDWINQARRAKDLDDVPSFRHFRSDQEDRPFSGLMGVGVADAHWKRLRLEMPELACASMGQDAEVHTDWHHFGFASAAALLSQGARHLVYLRTLSGSAIEDVSGAREAAARAQATLRVEQLPPRGPHYDESRDAAICANLAADWDRQGLWPDAIMISDDVTMRGLAHALLAHGARRVNALRVLSWGNRGIRLHYGFPVARYEVDLADYAHALLALVKSRAEGPSMIAPGGVAIRGRIVEPDSSLPTVAE